ncbi:hypothetical protein LY78DRAFT_253086 [Colletotrichum sublineola]|nr:hypothetical protein LY78DRAFT_253086 [Colletotrichum sublineola]
MVGGTVSFWRVKKRQLHFARPPLVGVGRYRRHSSALWGISSLFRPPGGATAAGYTHLPYRVGVHKYHGMSPSTRRTGKKTKKIKIKIQITSESRITFSLNEILK